MLLSFTKEHVETIEVRVTPFACIAQVFDLTVEHEWHTFLSEDLVVHNKQPPPCRLPSGTTLFEGEADTPPCACDGSVGRFTCRGGSLFCDDCGKVLPDGGTPDAGP